MTPCLSLLQDDNSWLGIQGDKVQLVRNLAQLAVAGRAEVAGASNARQQQQQQGSHDAGQLPLASMLRVGDARTLKAACSCFRAAELAPFAVCSWFSMLLERLASTAASQPPACCGFWLHKPSAVIARLVAHAHHHSCFMP